MGVRREHDSWPRRQPIQDRPESRNAHPAINQNVAPLS
jgi:hypothetical protein